MGSLTIASQHQVVSGRPRVVGPASWLLWSQPRRVVWYVLVVDLAVAGLAALSLYLIPVPSNDLGPFAVLLACCVGYGEASRPVERLHRRRPRTPYIDLNSVWTFAGILLLHPVLTAVLVAVFNVHRWVRVAHRPVHRVTFSAAAAICGTFAATGFLALAGHSDVFTGAPRDLAGFVLIGLAAAVFLVVDSVLVSTAIALSTPNPTLRTATGDWADYGLEAATLALGALLAWALVDWPAMAVSIVGVTLVLHGRVLIRQLKEAARTDPKTGLLNTAAWYESAHRELERAARQGTSVGVLIIDLDHFKRVNDAHGHLAGDEVLVAVAKTIAGELRGYDLVGRFGGEEFVALLPSISGFALFSVAERIRHQIAALSLNITGHHGPDRFRGLTASTGIAVFPRHGESLEKLLRAADGALFAAKAAGRNQIQLATVITNGRPISHVLDNS